MMRRFLFRCRILTLAVSVIVLGGCINLGLGKGTTESTKFYVLHALDSPEAEKKADSLDVGVIGVGPVNLSQYLNRPQIMIRVSQNEYQVAPFAQWAEPLRDNFSGVLADNLSVLLETDKIAIFPWKTYTPIDYKIEVDVIRFDGEKGGDVRLHARWIIFDKDSKTLFRIRKSSFSATADAGNYGAMVSAMSQTLEDLSREIADSIKELSHEKTSE
jgi:hypothetical protein